MQEMQAAMEGSDRGRLQEAIKGGVTWLSHNGSNPDVAPNSAEVLSLLLLTSCTVQAYVALKAAGPEQGVIDCS